MWILNIKGVGQGAGKKKWLQLACLDMHTGTSYEKRVFGPLFSEI